MKLVKTDGAANKNINCILTLAAMGASVGDRIAQMYRYQINNIASAGYVTCSLNFRDSGGTTLRSITPISQVSENRSGVVYFEAVIPANTYDIRMDFGFSTSGTADLYIGQLALVDLTTAGVPSLCAAS